IVTNIEETYLAGVFPGIVPRDDLMVGLPGQKIRGIRKYYEQGEPGKLMAIVNSWGYVEIAVNRGSAFRQLGLKEKKSLEIFISAAV
ncbi:MAG: SAM-dependent chlorinase/fluorinase, partial [Candidatus Krumholzibacteria bacterium]|nr:SAM-dependent chlorinase/fluorinase [Candidatus Krumholzibacteria bacterium]